MAPTPRLLLHSGMIDRVDLLSRSAGALAAIMPIHTHGNNTITNTTATAITNSTANGTANDNTNTVANAHAQSGDSETMGVSLTAVLLVFLLLCAVFGGLLGALGKPKKASEAVPRGGGGSLRSTSRSGSLLAMGPMMPTHAYGGDDLGTARRAEKGSAIEMEKVEKRTHMDGRMRERWCSRCEMGGGDGDGWICPRHVEQQVGRGRGRREGGAGERGRGRSARGLSTPPPAYQSGMPQAPPPAYRGGWSGASWAGVGIGMSVGGCGGGGSC